MGWSLRVIPILTLATIALPALPAFGQRGPDDRVTAAIQNARSSLREQIVQEPIGRSLTIGDLLNRTGAVPQFTATLERCEMIGGPRWLDDQTVEVHLEISGTRVVRALTQIAAAHPGKAPVTADALEVNLANLARRSFAATGTSTGAGEAMKLRPAGAAGWDGVKGDESRRAVAAAQADAVHQQIEAVRPIALPDGQTVGKVLDENAAVRKAVLDYLSSRPVTSVRFQPERRVELEMASPGPQLFEIFHDAAIAERAVKLPEEDPWVRVRDEFLSHSVSAVGRGRVTDENHGGAVTTTPARVAPAAPAPRLPPRPPEWIGRQLDAEGTARGTSLIARRAAEGEAVQKIRAKLTSLPWDDGKTLGDAAKDDAGVQRALERCERFARVYKTDYDVATGNARVKVALDLRDLWQELLASAR